jgi:hypothetical protein
MILLTGCNLPSLDPIEVCLETFADAGEPLVCRCFLYEADIDAVGAVGEPYDIDISLCPSSVRMSADDFVELNTFHERVRERYLKELRNN